jgi:hypothetical protein
MPAGKIVAGIFDRVTGDAISLTRVVDLPAGKTVVVTPVPPRDESDVLVVLRRPIQPTREALTLTLRAGGTTRAPDVFLHAVDAVFAVWFGADGRTATVSIESESLAHPPVTVQLRPAKVTTLRGTLQPKPKLKISVRSPTDAVFGKLEATVSGGDGSESPGRVVDLRSGEPASVLVPPTRVRVLLTADSWRMEKEVDLTDGRDGEVEFLLEPIAISGRIYLGKDAVAGRVVFQDDGRELMTAETDPSGEYRAVFWRPGMYVASVSAAADSAAPFLDPAVPVEYDATVDFHLPVNRVIVQVRDSLSGKPVPRAEIGIHSTGEHKIVGELALGQRQLADEQGRFVLPRLRPGTVRIEASAAGYERSGPRMLTIDATTEEELTIELRPAEAIRITVQLPDGSAAAGAEAAAFDALGTPLWHGETGSEGVLSIPLALLSRHLVVRHPNAASMILRAATPDQTIRLSEPAIPVVNVHTTDSSGEPVRFASLTLWLAGVRLNGSAAAFATWTAAAATDNTASWAGRNFQAAPLRILATRGTPPASIATGAYDAFAETLEGPRPEITLVVTR